MKGATRNILAVDLGASNGRVIVGRVEGERLSLEIAHRFEHGPQTREGRTGWDWPRIIASIREGLGAAGRLVGDEGAVSLSCDSWAIDFGLLDAEGRLLFAPVSYRDKRTEGMPQSFADVIAPDELLRRVGAMASPITTLCQLRAMAMTQPDLLQQAEVLLHMADLVHHDLCGARVTDRTMATASQLCNLQTGDWDRELLEALGIAHHYLPQVAQDSSVIGHIRGGTGPHQALRGVPVVSCAGHDTAAAASVLPAAEAGAAFVSSGTWSMLGCSTNELLIPDTPARDELDLIGLPGDRWGIFRPIMGLWLLQECRRIWAGGGLSMTYEEITAQARACPCQSVIDPDDPRFLGPKEMPGEIRDFCTETGQPAPTSPGEVASVVLNSLALDYHTGIETLARVTGVEFRVLHIAGGGSANGLLCQLTANVTGLTVIAGPAEATAIGNILLQARAMGVVREDADLPALVASCFPLKRYEPLADCDDHLCDSFKALKLEGPQ